MYFWIKKEKSDSKPSRLLNVVLYSALLSIERSPNKKLATLNYHKEMYSIAMPS